jgi:hypothetical protein
MAPAGSAHPHHPPRIYRPCLVAQENLRKIPELTEDASPEAPCGVHDKACRAPELSKVSVLVRAPGTDLPGAG